MADGLRLRAARALLAALPLIMRNVGAGMRTAGAVVSPLQHRLLAAIAARPRTLSQIAEMQGVTPATATALVTTLENRGWVHRDHDSEDRRRVVVSLTETGRAHLLTAQRVAERAMASALEPLDDEALERLLGGLGVLTGLRAPSETLGDASVKCAGPTRENGAAGS